MSVCGCSCGCGVSVSVSVSVCAREPECTLVQTHSCTPKYTLTNQHGARKKRRKHVGHAKHVENGRADTSAHGVVCKIVAPTIHQMVSFAEWSFRQFRKRSALRWERHHLRRTSAERSGGKASGSTGSTVSACNKWNSSWSALAVAVTSSELPVVGHTTKQGASDERGPKYKPYHTTSMLSGLVCMGSRAHTEPVAHDQQRTSTHIIHYRLRKLHSRSQQSLITRTNTSGAAT